MGGAEALPSWLAPLPDAGQMAAIDRWAIEEQGIPSLNLMERAGAGVAGVVDELVGEGPVAVVCGKGNNGGDGLVVSRLLAGEGREVRTLLAADPDELRGDARVNLERLGSSTVRPFGADSLAGAAVVVDALLGTGSEGEPHGPVAEAIRAIGAVERPVVAVDVPSGVNASTGEVAGVAIRARATVTFHAAKPGLWIAPGKSHAGQVRVIDLGIPDNAPHTVQVGLIDGVVREQVPHRRSDSTKFSSGHVLVVGGSAGLTGAPSLACEAAMRAGAGYVTACVPASLHLVFEARLLEVMTRALPDESGALTEAGADTLLVEADRRGGAMVLGPGLGTREDTRRLARRLAAEVPGPLVLDADGLNAHAGALADLARRGHATVLTPHAGELGRLLEIDSDEVHRHRLARVRDAARMSGAIVVLKGDDTLVAEPGGRVAVNPGGAPALATAGTGDVLSGVVGAFLARGVDAFAAACAAVFTHGQAGRLAARERSADGVIASDVIAALPLALRGELRR
ncbi:MAG TPA: NAD(P)H-hydrate dehydratase [Solirubrobacteraceae bacterium]|jgi:NAD(P)H-hydrate epimerase|nr:NAD(P)H-hydrate dehydratase [Solirubrobacteraceae bacterium]